MKKIGILFALMVFLGQAQAQVYYKSGTFKVIDAVKTTFHPGVQGSPTTTTVAFKMVVKSCCKLNFDSFWMDGFADKVEVRYSHKETWDGKPMQGDTLLVVCSYFVLPERENFPNQPEFTGSNVGKTPVSHKGGLLFRYNIKGKNYYYSIVNIKKGESVYAP